MPTPAARLDLPQDLEAAEGERLGSPPSGGLFGAFRRRGKPQAKGNVWDSPLLLIGGGALLVLLIAGVVLLWAVTRQSGDELWRIAEESYANGSYTRAIQDYNNFLEKAPGHAKASAARIKRGLAKMRQATEGGTPNWPAALDVTKSVLAEISQEKDFRSEAQADLAAILPKIAEGLATEAHKQTKPELVAQAEESLALIDKYVNKSFRNETKLADVRALLAVAGRNINRTDRLAKALAEMGQAITAGRADEAYQIRNSLLREYPDLGDNEQLRAAVLAVSQAEQSAVQFAAQEQPAETAPPAATAATTVTLARREAVGEVATAQGWIICAQAGGAVYGLDAASGKVRWRRPVGFHDNGRTPSFPPTPVADTQGSDVLIVDGLHNAILRLRASTGETVWQFTLPEPFEAHPVLAGNQVLLAARSGRLVLIDLESGASPGCFEFPQELRVGPAVDSEHTTIFEVAEHSNLFMVSLADKRCTGVLYLGHEAGSVVVPPVILGQYLVIARCDSLETTTLQVFKIVSGNEGPKLEFVQSLPLKGRVTTTPLVSGRRLFALTDKAEMTVFELSDADPSKPLSAIAQGVAGGEEDVVRFPLLLEGQFFLGDDQLSKYDILASRGRLQPRWNVNQRSATLQPLQQIGQAIFQVRSKQGLPGVAVSAVDREEGKTLWETHLAAPLATEPAYDASADLLTAVSSSGGLFELKGADLGSNVIVDEPKMGVPLADVRQPVSDAVRLDPQQIAIVMGKGAREVSIFNTSEGRIRPLPLPDPLGGPTAAMAGTLVTPLAVGEVFLLDPFTGEKRSEPFQPTVKAGTSYAWQKPLVTSSGEILLTDGRQAIYRIVSQDAPKPHLAGVGSLALSTPVVSSLAVAGPTGFAVTADGQLMSFTLPELKAGATWPLAGRFAWGPWAVGDRVLVASSEQLLCVDANQKKLWEVALPHGPLVGAPLGDGGGLVVASAGGVVCRLDPATGQVQAKVEIGLPLGTGPAAFKDRLVLGGYEGSLYLISKP